MTLSIQQQSIVSHIVNETSSLNVIARAGTGKTYTLIEGVIEAIVSQQLGSVALMAFNKSIADEFKAKLEAKEFFEVEAGTIHSFGLRALKRIVNNSRRDWVSGYKIDDIMKEMNIQDFTFQIKKLVSLAKQSGIGIVTSIDDNEAWQSLIDHFDIEANGDAGIIIEKSIEVLEASNKAMKTRIDFDDMIYLPLLHKVRFDKYDFVLIDEAQDTNETRRLLAMQMLAPTGRMIAVGDPKQAIYGFTGANSDSMDRIKNVMNSAELPLTVTYRCPKSVVAEANRIVPDLVANESNIEGAVRTIETMVEVEA